MDHTQIPFTTLIPFAELYAVPRVPASGGAEEVIDLENPGPSPDAVLPCVAAMDFLAEAKAREGGEGTANAIKIWKTLADKHDIMRKKYVIVFVLLTL